MLLSRSRRRKSRNNSNNNIGVHSRIGANVDNGATPVASLSLANATNTRSTSAKKSYNNINNNNNNNNNINSVNSRSKRIINRDKRKLQIKEENIKEKKEQQQEQQKDKNAEKEQQEQQQAQQEIALEQTLKQEEEEEQQEQDSEMNQEKQQEQEQEQEKKSELKLKKLDDKLTVTTATSTGTTVTNTTTTSVSPQPEKVLYDNRIKRKNVLALNEKVAAIREYEKMPVYKRIGRMFQCSPDQIKRIVQQKDSILKAWEQRTRRCQDAKTLEMKVVRVSMLGKAVYDWIRRMMYYKDFMITDGLIQKMALQFKSAMGLQTFFPHQDWCDKFRQTYKIYQHDSKLLSIGYTQGHSVQIKDIVKDVLSECTPDLVNGDNLERELGPTAAKQLKVSPKLLKQERKRDENGNETKDCSNPITSISSSSSSSSLATTTTISLTTTTNTLASANNNNGLQPVPSTNATLRQLNLPQLVSLSHGLGNMPQKVLVATPITTNTSALNGQHLSGNNTHAVATSTPMTMTIIPLATITQPLGSAATQMPVNSGPLIAANTKQQQQQNRIVPPPMVEIKCEIKEEQKDEDEGREEQNEQNELPVKVDTVTTTTKTATNLDKAEESSEPERPLLVAPITIKQEYFSDGEDTNDNVEIVSRMKETKNDVADTTTPTTNTNITIADTNTITVATTTQSGVIKVKSRESTPAGGEDTMDSTDYDNLALSSLKKIIQSKAAANKSQTVSAIASSTTVSPIKNETGNIRAATARTITAEAATSSTTSINDNTKTQQQLTAILTPGGSAIAKMSMKNTPTLTLAPIETLRGTPLPLPPMVALSQLTRAPNQLHANNNNTNNNQNKQQCNKINNNNNNNNNNNHINQNMNAVTTTNGNNGTASQRHIALISHNGIPMPPLAMPPLTKAPIHAAASHLHAPLPALIPRSTVSNNNGATATLLPFGYRLATKRKLRSEQSCAVMPTSMPTQLPPIKTCLEARRYLKLLEDFALLRENFRLIGLITRADELLRELDGDDDVDID